MLPLQLQGHPFLFFLDAQLHEATHGAKLRDKVQSLIHVRGSEWGGVGGRREGREGSRRCGQLRNSLFTFERKLASDK